MWMFQNVWCYNRYVIILWIYKAIHYLETCLFCTHIDLLKLRTTLIGALNRHTYLLPWAWICWGNCPINFIHANPVPCRLELYVLGMDTPFLVIDPRKTSRHVLLVYQPGISNLQLMHMFQLVKYFLVLGAPWPVTGCNCYDFPPWSGDCDPNVAACLFLHVHTCVLGILVPAPTIIAVDVDVVWPGDWLSGIQVVVLGAHHRRAEGQRDMHGNMCCHY